MKTFIFYDEIIHATVNELIEKIELVEDSNEHIQILFSSMGGGYNTMNMLIHYIKNSEKYIQLVGSGEISSAGFILFFSCGNNNKILDGSYSVIHLGTRSVETRDLMNNKTFDNFASKMLLADNKSIIEWYSSLGVTYQELNRLKKGEDIYFDTNRLNEILKGVQK